MDRQYEILPCPFCKENTISCIYFPSVTNAKVSSTATFGKTTKRTKSPDVWIIQSGCNKCGKTLEEIETRLKADRTI